MRDGGRLSAAIAILEAIETRYKPVRLALKAWGDDARFAGAKDRAFVSGLVLDVLRRRRSLGFRMEDDSRRAAVLGALRFEWSWPIERIAQACMEAPHGPGALTPAEGARLNDPRDLAAAPPPIRGDYPDWLDEPLTRAFGGDRAAEGAGLAERAPVDLRVNTLKASRNQVLEALAGLGAEISGPGPDVVRVPAPAASERAAPVEAHPSFALGWFEVQDAGSQLAAAVAGDVAGLDVLDLCAGGGGKTLALGAAMAGQGRLFAYDADARRMRDIIPRAQRAGITNLSVRTPLDADPLADLVGTMDLVFVDAPCTGSGTWRRHPDAKWRLKPDQLAVRMREQDRVLDQAAKLVKPGGQIVYVTCSLLAEENEDRVEAFAGRSGFVRRPAQAPGAEPYITTEGCLRLTPRRAGTDGFFAAVLERPQDSG